MNYILINNSKKIREKKKISISDTLKFMGWSNRSILFKKENNIIRTTVKEALMLSILLGEPVHKIFTLKVSKNET